MAQAARLEESSQHVMETINGILQDYINATQKGSVERSIVHVDLFPVGFQPGYYFKITSAAEYDAITATGIIDNQIMLMPELYVPELEFFFQSLFFDIEWHWRSLKKPWRGGKL